MSSKEKEDRLKLGKERLHNETKVKGENKRKQQEISLTVDICRLKRKHLVMFHRLEYDLLLNEINEQKAVLLKNHHLLEQHLNATYLLKQRHLNILQKYLSLIFKRIVEENSLYIITLRVTTFLNPYFIQVKLN